MSDFDYLKLNLNDLSSKHFDALTKEFANLLKNNKKQTQPFKLKIVKTKKSDEYLNYISSLKKIPKINSHFGFDRDPPVKMKLKKHTEDNQNKKFEFNTLAGYYKVFQKEDNNLYGEEYMRKMFNLLNKKDKNYYTKRKYLTGDPTAKSTNPPKIQPVYKDKVENKIGDIKQMMKEKKTFSDKMITSDDNRDIKFKETYDSEFSISDGALDDSFKRKIVTNLNTEYNFYDKTKKTPMTTYNHTKTSSKSDFPRLVTTANIENTSKTQKFFLTQFPKKKPIKSKAPQKITYNTMMTTTSSFGGTNFNQRKFKIEQIEKERNEKIKSLLNNFKSVE